MFAWCTILVDSCQSFTTCLHMQTPSLVIMTPFSKRLTLPLAEAWFASNEYFNPSYLLLWLYFLCDFLFAFWSFIPRFLFHSLKTLRIVLETDIIYVMSTLTVYQVCCCCNIVTNSKYANIIIRKDTWKEQFPQNWYYNNKINRLLVFLKCLC